MGQCNKSGKKCGSATKSGNKVPKNEKLPFKSTAQVHNSLAIRCVTAAVASTYAASSGFYETLRIHWTDQCQHAPPLQQTSHRRHRITSSPANHRAPHNKRRFCPILSPLLQQPSPPPTTNFVQFHHRKCHAWGAHTFPTRRLSFPIDTFEPAAEHCVRRKAKRNNDPATRRPTAAPILSNHNKRTTHNRNRLGATVRFGAIGDWLTQTSGRVCTQAVLGRALIRSSAMPSID